MEGGFKISTCYSRGLSAFLQFYQERGGGIWCLWSVCRWLNQWCLVFCSIGSRCHSGWWEWNLGRLAQFQSLNFGFPVVELSLSRFPVRGFSIRGTPTWILWVTNFQLSLYKLLFRISGGMKFWDLSWELQDWRAAFNCCSDRILNYDFCSNSDMWTLFEKQWERMGGGSRNH